MSCITCKQADPRYWYTSAVPTTPVCRQVQLHQAPRLRQCCPQRRAALLVQPTATQAQAGQAGAGGQQPRQLNGALQQQQRQCCSAHALTSCHAAWQHRMRLQLLPLDIICKAYMQYTVQLHAGC